MSVTEAYKSLKVRGKMESDPGALALYLTSNPLVENDAPPACVLKPADQDELRDLLQTPGPGLVCVSSGGPHVKGGIACSQPHAKVDLSHWNKITWINRRNRVCIIEPGVTYGQLIEALAPHGMTVPMPLAPRSSKSVLAACVDREPSTWPNKQWDYQDPVASTEFLFGTGKAFRSGAAGGPGTLEQQRQSKGAQKAPLGPGQSDFQRVVMGSQGSLGIMTWISLRAELAPSVQETFLTGDSSLDKIIPFTYAVQRPWLGEQAFIVNRTALAMLLSHEKPERFRDIREALPEFIALQNVAGFERLPEERLAYQKADVLDFAAQNRLELGNDLAGITANEVLKTATTPCGNQDWRHRRSGHCLSVIFLSLLNQAPGLVEIFKNLGAAAGVADEDMGVYIQPVVQNHACNFEFLVPFDPKDTNRTAAMKSLEKDLCARLMNAGAYFSRPYGAALDLAFEANPGHVRLMRLAKEIFDPGKRLAPGKFGL